MALVMACGEIHDSDAGDAALVEDSGVDPLDGGLDAGADGGDSGQDAGPNLRSIFLDFCIQTQRLRCQGRVDCCTSIERGGSGECLDSTVRPRCEELAADPALGDGTLTWREDEAARVLADLQAALPVCGAVDRGGSFGDVLEGTLAPGADCTPFKPDLDSLGRFGCQEGLRCALTGTRDDYEGRCTTPGASGDTCNHDCGSGLYCQYDTEPFPYWGTCEVRDDAAGCRSDFGCTEYYCESGVCISPAPENTWCSQRG